MSLMEVMVTLRKTVWRSWLQIICGTTDWQFVWPFAMSRLGMSEGIVLAEDSLIGMVIIKKCYIGNVDNVIKISNPQETEIVKKVKIRNIDI